MKLSDSSCKRAKPKEKAYKLADGLGMYLEVMPNGSKYWRLKYRVDSKEKRISFGVYPEVPLKDARNKREEARKLIADGIDPSFARKHEKLHKNQSNANTFEVVAREWHSKKFLKWSSHYSQTIMNRLESDVFPRIGNYPIKELTPPIMLSVLQEIEKRGVYELTRRVKQYCGQIFRYAISVGLVERDVTADLRGALETLPTGHYASIEPDELPQLIRDIERNDARMYPTTRLALEFMLHTFVRTGELIQAKWDEFNIKEARWIIPAERMKMKKAHIVPLSTQSLAILNELHLHTGHYDWVFASPTRPRNHMSNNAILTGLKRMGYKGRMTGHGFRSLAMTSILEKLHYPFDVVDAQLAHGKRNALGEAYDRAKYLQQRTEMMQDWSDYIEKFTNNRNFL